MFGMRRDLTAAVLVLSLFALTNCASDELSKKSSEAVARTDCPPGTAARIESDYDRDISGIDEQRCLAFGPAGSERYQKCRYELHRDREDLGPLRP
jgi:hypothetical protein